MALPTLPADVGSYTIVGSSSVLAFTLNAAVGSYSVTGTAAELPVSDNHLLACMGMGG